MPFRIDPGRIDLAREFKANIYGRHSGELQRILRIDDSPLGKRSHEERGRPCHAGCMPLADRTHLQNFPIDEFEAIFGRVRRLNPLPIRAPSKQ